MALAAPRVVDAPKPPCIPCQARALSPDEKLLADAARAVKPGKALVLPWSEKGPMTTTIEGLKALGWQLTTIERGKGQWKDEAIAAIRKEKFDLFVTWQRLYDGWGAELKKELNARNIRQLYIDFGVWPHYGSGVFDPQAENAESVLVGELDALEASALHAAAASASLPRLQDMRKSLNDRATAAAGHLADMSLADLPRPFVFLALQRTGDSVTRFDAPTGRADMGKLLKDVVNEAAAQKRYVVCKLHPLDDKINLAGINVDGPHHRLLPRKIKGNDEAVAWLTRECSHMITVNSTMTYNALALNKPVVALGRGWFSGNGVVSEFSTIRGAVRGAAEPDPKRIERFMCHMLSRSLPSEQCRDKAKLARILALMHKWEGALSEVTMNARLSKRLRWSQTHGVPTKQITEEVAAVFKSLDARRFTPRTFLEIGAQHGGSLWSYASLVPVGGTIAVIDTGGAGGDQNLARVLTAIRTEGKHITHLRMDSSLSQTVDRVKSLFPGGIDLIHIDGDHHEKSVLLDYAHYVPMLRPGGVALFHDIEHTDHHCEVPKAWAKIRGEQDTLEFVHQRGRNGIGMVRAKRAGVLYTAIFGGKDSGVRAPAVIENEMDYVVFTDNPDLRVGFPWVIRVVKPEYDNPILASKVFKVFPWKYLPGYQFSVYQDAARKVLMPVFPLMHRIKSRSAGAFFWFKKQATVYSEAAKNVRLDRVDAGRQKALVAMMDAAGYSCARPVVCGGFHIRKHGDERMTQAMEFWWDLVMKYGPRDQIAMNFALWRFNVPYETGRLWKWTNWKAHAVSTNGQWRKHPLPKVA